MRPPSDPKTARSSDPWAAYVPCDEAPWESRRVVHLHRRAGFAATWGEIRRDLKDGPRPSLDRVLAGKAATDGVPADFEKTADLLGGTATTSDSPVRLKAWWVYCMLFGESTRDPCKALAGTRPGDDAVGFVRRSMLNAYTGRGSG